MESSIAEFLFRQLACELLPTVKKHMGNVMPIEVAGSQTQCSAY